MIELIWPRQAGARARGEARGSAIDISLMRFAAVLRRVLANDQTGEVGWQAAAQSAQPKKPARKTGGARTRGRHWRIQFDTATCHALGRLANHRIADAVLRTPSSLVLRPVSGKAAAGRVAKGLLPRHRQQALSPSSAPTMMSQGLAIEDALVARPDTLFGVRLRSLGEMLSDALALRTTFSDCSR
jgi:hypothetical protein